MKSKTRTLKEKKHLKELRQRIEAMAEYISDADSTWLDLKDAQAEHKKLTGKGWVW